MNPRLLDALLLTTVVLVTALVWVTGQTLPEPVATSFGALGLATGHADLTTHLWLMTLLAAGLPLLVGYGLTPLAGRDGQRLNIPNKAYWLAPERRAATLADARLRFKLLGALLSAFMAGVHLLLVQANRQQPPRLASGLLLALSGALMLCMGAWVVALHLRYGRAR